jgi:ABC-type siderophore export system fused ATPase/permease subunit
MATNVAAAFLELKRVCRVIESDSQKLKTTVSGGERSVYVGTERETETFAKRLEEKVDEARSQLNALETNLYGPAEKRLSQVTFAEVPSFLGDCFICCS